MTILECLDALSLPRLFLWASGTAGIVAVIVAIYRFNKGDNHFRIVDLLTEGDPPKASLNKLILVGFALLSAWVTVNAALDNKVEPNVVNLLLGVLGIFVIGRAANQAVAQFSARPQRPDQRVQIQSDETTVTQSGDPDPEPPVARRKSSVLK